MLPQEDGTACLHIAASCGHDEVVEVLMAHGVDTGYVDQVFTVTDLSVL